MRHRCRVDSQETVPAAAAPPQVWWRQKPVDDTKQEDETTPPLEVLTAWLGGPRRASELVASAGPFDEPRPAETLAYTIAALGEVQNASEKDLGFSEAQLVARNKFGVTLLHKACRYPNWKSARYIAERAPQLCGCRDDLGRVPLHDACWNEKLDFDVVELLLRLHPEALLSADHRGHTPLCYAPRKAWPAWNRFIRQRQASFVPALLSATAAPSCDIVGAASSLHDAHSGGGKNQQGEATTVDAAADAEAEAVTVDGQENQRERRPRSFSYDDIAGEFHGAAQSSRFFSLPAAASANDLGVFDSGKRKRTEVFDAGHPTLDDDDLDLDDLDDDDDDDDLDDSFSETSSASSDEKENWALASEIADQLHRGRELSKRRCLRNASALTVEAQPPEDDDVLVVDDDGPSWTSDDDDDDDGKNSREASRGQAWVASTALRVFTSLQKKNPPPPPCAIAGRLSAR